jgi:hypothetical protein
MEHMLEFYFLFFMDLIFYFEHHFCSIEYTIQSLRNLPYCKQFYIDGIKCLPDNYLEIMNVMSNREIRVYFPIQELNLLLEPIKRPGELDQDQVEPTSDRDESNDESLESLSARRETSDESDDEENDDDAGSTVSSFNSCCSSTNMSVSEFDLKDL